MTWLPNEYGTEVFVVSEHETTPDSFGSKQKCPHCEREFSTRSGMLGHMETYHKKEGQG